LVQTTLNVHRPQLAVPGRLRKTAEMSCGLAAVVLALQCLAMAATAATRAPMQREDGNDSADYCLPVRSVADDGAVVLRLAMPPIDASGGIGTLQAVMSRLLGSRSPAAPGASSPAMPALPAFLGGGGSALSPVATLIVDGGADAMAGRHADAERALTHCVQLAGRQGDSLAAGACANNLALVYAAQGRFTKAQAELERALRHYDTPRVPPADIKVPAPAQASIDFAMAQLPAVLQLLPPEERAKVEAQMQARQAELAPRLREAAIAAWQKTERLNTQRGVERSMLNLGNLALASGRLADAQSLLQRALKERAPDESAQCKAAAATDLARVYRRLGRPAESQALLAQHRATPGRDTSLTLFELGTVSLAPASAGDARAAAEPERASPAAPSFFNEPAGRFGDTTLAQLLAQARRDTAALPAPQAMASWRRLALRAEAGQRPDLAYAAHAALMRLHMAGADTASAIYHGKRAANLAQATRASLQDHSPSRDARRAFLRDRRAQYVALAQLLLDQQRLLEAESVLQLLKEDEGQQFMAAAATVTLGRLPLLPAEQALQQQDAAVVSRVQQAEQARIAATTNLPLGAGGMLMAAPEQIEAARLRLGLAVPGLPAQLKRKPLNVPSGEGMGQTLLREVRALLVGPDGRLERFLAHLAEDAPYFNPPASAQELAQLGNSLKNVRQIQAELVPLLSDAALAGGPAVSVSVGHPGRSGTKEREVQVWDYVTADMAERMWRSAREADQIEARYLQQVGERSAAMAPQAAAGLPDEMRALLANQPLPTALLYYLPGDERLDVVLVSATGRKHWRLALSRKQLDSEVQNFAEALRNAARDPRPAAQAMYARLFSPVAQAVADSGARVLALSLADKLRFVPFAALHDGQGWLVERYAMALHPGGALASRLKPASPHWRVAAFGASAGSGEFPPLLSVRSEITSVVRQGSASGGAQGGALPGEAWLDQAFTAQRLRAAVGGDAQVLHVASHFKFVAGDAEASYLLLGDGSTLSLRELAGPDYRFDRTELVTLSACATGLSADDTFGQEVDGLAALLMGQGAPSVLASLWEVNDKSTATLMASLYRLRESRQLARVLALQQAQLAMIRSADTALPPASAAASQTRSVSRIRLPGDPEPAPGEDGFAPPASLGYGHPFHWAAFVLMGNWR